MTDERLDPASTPPDSDTRCNIAGKKVRVEGEEGLGKDVPVIMCHVLENRDFHGNRLRVRLIKDDSLVIVTVSRVCLGRAKGETLRVCRCLRSCYRLS